MYSVSVEADVKQAMKYLNDVEKKVVRQAASSALNHATRSTKSKVGSMIAKMKTVPVKSARRRLPITHRANFKALWTEIIFRNRDFNVATFKPAPRQLKKGGVKFKGGHWPSGFYLPPGHTSVAGYHFPKGLVLRRKSKIRSDLEPAKIEIAVDGERVLRRFGRREFPVLFRKRFNHEMERRLAKLRK